MSTRIGVITDAHANLPATEAALAAIDAAGCEVVIHMGDAIGIGPHPREVMDLLLNQPAAVLLLGNHDELFAFDRLRTPPEWISAGELEHQHWTHALLPNEWRERVAKWPLTHEVTIGFRTIRLQHYAINDEGFGPISRDNLAHELDASFRPTTDIVCFGHHHLRADVQGLARYINPGALGTNPCQGARYAVIDELTDGTVDVSLHSAPYDAKPVRQALLERGVPEAAFILETFLKS